MTATQPVNPLTADLCCAIDDFIVNEMSAPGITKNHLQRSGPSPVSPDPKSRTIEFNAKLRRRNRTLSNARDPMQ